MIIFLCIYNSPTQIAGVKITLISQTVFLKLYRLFVYDKNKFRFAYNSLIVKFNDISVL